MSAQHRTYRIRTVLDFQDVPEDKLDACLKEFRTFVRIIAPFRALVGDCVRVSDEFTWVDDGENNIIINIHDAGNGQEHHE